MNIVDLKNLLTELIGNELYINEFPPTNECAMKFTVSDVEQFGRGLETYYIRLGSKANHPLELENGLRDVVARINRKTNVIVGDVQVVQIICESMTPKFEGKLENGQYYYSLEFTMKIFHVGVK